jgi:hypothetical protein
LNFKAAPAVTRLLQGLCALQILGFSYYFIFFSRHGYLPSPFIYDKWDTFMDFFHVMYWSDNAGRYTDWGSIYPPMNFLFMKALHWLFLGQVKFGDGFAIRQYSHALQFLIVAAYVALPAWAMTTRLWSGFSNVQRVLLYVFWVLSAPILFGMERGNLVMICLIFVATALEDDGWKRLVAIALLINIKPYFTMLLVAPALAGKWEDSIATGLLAAAIFIATGLILDPNFLYFFENLFNFSQASVFSGREVLALPSSIAAFAYALKAAISDGSQVVGSSGLNISTLSVAVIWINQMAIALSLTVLLLSARYLTQTQIIAILLVVTTNLGVWTGGYLMLIYPLLIPVLMTFHAKRIHLTLLILILLQADVIVLFRDSLGVRNVFLSHSAMTLEYQLGLGTVLRPTLNLCLLATLTLEALARVRFYQFRYWPTKGDPPR